MTLINRRRFIQQSALSAAVASFPSLLLAKSGNIKTTATPGFKADVEIEFTAHTAQIRILATGPATQVQTYSAKLIKGPRQTLQQLPDNFLGPVLNFQQGQKVRVFFKNNLNEPSIIHWHGLHVPQRSDGHPMYSIESGEQFVYEFEVMNRAGTSFYHSHSHNLTAEQVYRGLAGLIVVTDSDERKLDLPSGEFDVPLVIQDRSFGDNNQLQYVHMMHQRMAGFLGDRILVNGKPDAEFKVKSAAYRFRAVNGSNSRIYKLGWDDGTPLTAIGTDACLLPKPETRPYIMLAPGERVDLWLDFSGRAVGSKLVMYSLPFSGTQPGMSGRGMGMMHKGLPQGAKFAIATFSVTEKVGDSIKLPEVLVPFQRLTLADVDNADKPLPIGISMKPMRPLLNGKSFAMDKVLDFERVALGAVKKVRIFHDHEMPGGGGMKHTAKVEVENPMRGMRMKKPMDHDESGQEHGGGKKGMGGGMGMMGGGMLDMAHPIHLHGQQFQVLRRVTGMVKADYASVKDGYIDSGWKDTVLVMPGEEVEIIKPFQDYKGLFLYHCHNLEHEDLGMMRQFLVE
ncbi:multicopper oxidase family protein [Methylomonas methanica]|uniref:Multicopper oxidase CueO n=1 Tax=Methylomonas methanica (strain DSM 25384 / MC09) TaxID=857087 RepID=F9ZYP7_METMM|nr:multicopper oxidase domain-containing protein [Methylomonas methanica]AEF98593.1 multicopper oxidase type 3 [Methylomonas methanica MC09]